MIGDLPDGQYVDRVTAEDRLTNALNRLAAAIELALPVLTDMSAPRRPAAPPPAVYQPTPVPSAAAPVYAPPVAAPVALGGLTVGSIHIQGHKPLRQNSRGLFCPTRLADGSYCQFHTA